MRELINPRDEYCHGSGSCGTGCLSVAEGYRLVGVHRSTYCRWLGRIHRDDTPSGVRGAGRRVRSPFQVRRILKHHGLDRAAFRYETTRLAMGLDIADAVTVPSGMHGPPSGAFDADIPGDLVQIDCFHIGRVK